MKANRLSFKAWDKVRKEWIHKEPCHLIGENCLLGGWLSSISIERLDDVVVLQSTGLQDKNGKEIFEGDVISTLDGMGRKVDMVVEWMSLMYETCGPDEEVAGFAFGDEAGRCEVIGNIHENPELISDMKGE